MTDAQLPSKKIVIDAMIIKIDLRFLKHIADSIIGGPNATTRTSPSLERCTKFTYSFLKAILEHNENIYYRPRWCWQDDFRENILAKTTLSVY